MKILIVDDEPFVLQVIEVVLKGAGHHLSMAGNGRDGLLAFEKAAFDVVLTDFNMPHLNGLEMAKAMKAANPNVKIVLMSGSAEHTQAAGALPPCIDFKLDKPLRLNSLRNMLSEIAA